MKYLQLFFSFVQIGLFSIGGGYAAMPLIQAQVVEKHSWLNLSEFTDLVTIAEMTPGPIAINSATFVGIRIAGIPGAVIATFGCILPSLFIVSALSFVYYKYKGLPLLDSILKSIRPAVVALIASAGVSILLQVMFGGGAMHISHINITGTVLFLAAFVALRKYKKNPILVMGLCGVMGLFAGII